MSFFNEFFEAISLQDDINNAYCNVVFGVGVRIFGRFKIESMQEMEIILKKKNERIRIFGDKLSIASMSKGEIEVEGNIQGVTRLWKEQLKLKLMVWTPAGLLMNWLIIIFFYEISGSGQNMLPLRCLKVMKQI